MGSNKKINVLIPTYERCQPLAVTLTSLYYQLDQDFDIVISDQSETTCIEEDQSIQCIVRLLQTRGIDVRVLHNLPRKGMAQQRQFLLDQSQAPYSLFLDDDLVLEPFVIRNMRQMLEKLHCGFIGCAVIGLSYLDDWRAHQQHIEFWDTAVVPETIRPDSREWQRYVLHNAANVYHLQQKYHVHPDEPRPYKVAWVGGCIMYDTAKLRSTGGFTFWEKLPPVHCGEDVLAQLRVMKEYGGCGILPSGVYHQELTTTLPDRTVNAPEYLHV
jgi:GT2 family glycosyltransferase